MKRSAASVQIMAGLGTELGMTLRECLAQTGLRAAELTDPATEVSLEQQFVIIRNVLRHAGDPPGLGLKAGSRYHFTSLGPVGFAVVSSPNLRSALEVALRYGELASFLSRLSFEERDDAGCLILDLGEVPADLRRFALERAGAQMVTISRDLFGSPVRPLAVRLAFPRPAHVEMYRTFFGVAPMFGSPRNEVHLARADLERPLTHANPVALKMAEDQCRQLLSARNARSGFAGSVRDRIVRVPGHIPDMDSMAESMHLTPRTLRRRLREEGATYAALCDEVRQVLAEEMLSTPRLPIGTIAGRLGYADASSFIHAFKRWKNGQTPHQFRSRADR
ncbi:MAG: AraC family transcriptional regulator ligand-binding domain-containing protein [Panacagrimonas sp.]